MFHMSEYHSYLCYDFSLLAKKVAIRGHPFHNVVFFKLTNCQIYVFPRQILDEVNHGLVLFCYGFCMSAQDARSIPRVSNIKSEIDIYKQLLEAAGKQGMETSHIGS